MENITNVILCEPKEFKASDGASFVERYPDHYVLYIPDEICRDEIIQRLLRSPHEKARKRKKANPNRVNNSFIIYRMEKIKKIMEENPSVNQKVISQKCAEMWKNETTEVKAVYKEKYELLKRENKKIIAQEKSSKSDYRCIKVESIQSSSTTIFNELYPETTDCSSNYPPNCNNCASKDRNLLINEAPKYQNTSLDALAYESEKLNQFLNSTSGRHRRSVSVPRLMTTLPLLEAESGFTGSNAISQSLENALEKSAPIHSTRVATIGPQYMNCQVGSAKAVSEANVAKNDHIDLREWAMQMSSPIDLCKPATTNPSVRIGNNSSILSEHGLNLLVDTDIPPKAKIDAMSDLNANTNANNRVGPEFSFFTTANANNSLRTCNSLQPVPNTSNAEVSLIDPKNSHILFANSISQSFTDSPELFSAINALQVVNHQVSGHLDQQHAKAQTQELINQNFENNNKSFVSSINFLTDSATMTDQFNLALLNHALNSSGSVSSVILPQNSNTNEASCQFLFDVPSKNS